MPCNAVFCKYLTLDCLTFSDQRKAGEGFIQAARTHWEMGETLGRSAAEWVKGHINHVISLTCFPTSHFYFSVLEVHQFAQEAVVAEAWLTAQEPLLNSNELGGSVDEVEQLIRRHEAFRKAAATWEERFSSLRRLTTVTETSQMNTRSRCAQSCFWRIIVIKFSSNLA